MWRFSLWLLAGCSLTGIADFELAVCTTNDECAPLNVAEGIDADACELYLCAADHCVMGPRDADGDDHITLQCGGDDCDDTNETVSPTLGERCDAIDNDCDAAIDENVVGLGAPETLLASVAPVTSAASSDSFVFSDAQGAGTLLDVTSGQAIDLAFARGLNDANLMIPAMSPADECPMAIEGEVVGTTCRFADLDVSEASGARLFAAVVNDRGCADGQLRVGLVDRAEDPRVALRGPQVRSNTYLGIDVDSERPCTGASRASGRLGAARVAIASHHEESSAVALAAWLADGLDRPACGGDEVSVEVIGLFEEHGRSGARDIQWVTGTNGGLPQTLGTTRSGSAPAVVAVDSGFLVAFGDENGDLAVHFVQRPAAPSPIDPSARPDDTRATPSLRLAVPLMTIPSRSGDAVQAVAMTVAEDRVAIAWGEGCAGTIAVSTFTLGNADIHTFSEPNIVATDATGPPSLTTTGGSFALTVAQATRVTLFRIGLDGTLADDTETFASEAARFVAPFSSNGVLRVAFYDERQRAFRATSANACVGDPE